jgi:hypothetical protein
VSIVEQTLNFLRRRKRAYQLVFQKNAPQVQIVLGDLAKFCRATEDTHSKDPLNTAYLNGRRSVFLHLTQHLSLTPDELFLLYSNAAIAPMKDTDNG